jgi:hypothetical protein
MIKAGADNAMSPSKKRSAARADLPDARPIVLDAIHTSALPVAAADLGIIPALGRNLTAPKLRTLLLEDIAAGRVFLWGDAKQKAYWHRDPSAVARDRLLQLAGHQALTAKDLQQRASAESPLIAPKVSKAALAELMSEKRMEKVAGIIVDRRHPHPYLEMEIVKLLKPFGIEPGVERIHALLGDGGDPPVANTSVADAAKKMFAVLSRMAFSPGATVTFYRLRQDPELATIPKAIFDQAALYLQQERRALLSVHDHAAALPAEERDHLVTDGLGTYYVSIYAR